MILITVISLDPSACSCNKSCTVSLSIWCLTSLNIKSWYSVCWLLQVFVLLFFLGLINTFLSCTLNVARFGIGSSFLHFFDNCRSWGCVWRINCGLLAFPLIFMLFLRLNGQLLRLRNWLLLFLNFSFGLFLNNVWQSDSKRRNL